MLDTCVYEKCPGPIISWVICIFAKLISTLPSKPYCSFHIPIILCATYLALRPGHGCFNLIFQAHPIVVIDGYHCLDWKCCFWNRSNVVICICLYRKKNSTYKTEACNTITFFFFRTVIVLSLRPLIYFSISFVYTHCHALVFVIRIWKLQVQVYRNFSLPLSKMTVSQKTNKKLKERRHVYA